MKSDPGSPAQGWQLYLPFATTVYVYGYTNAAYTQKIIATPETGNVITMTGQGEGNRATSPASAVINTPSTGSHLNGFLMTVNISYQGGSGWVASQVAGAGCSLGWTAATYMVASEDWKDVDWNDAILQFLWYNPPAVRRAALTAFEDVRSEASAEAPGGRPEGDRS